MMFLIPRSLSKHQIRVFRPELEVFCHFYFTDLRRTTEAQKIRKPVLKTRLKMKKINLTLFFVKYLLVPF
jgi:hypothetical protein